MRRVIKHQVVGLTALIVVIVFLSGIVSAGSAVGNKSAVQPQSTAPASGQPADNAVSVKKSVAATASAVAPKAREALPAAANNAAAVAPSSSPQGTTWQWGAVEALVFEDTNCDGTGDVLIDGVMVSLYEVNGGSTFIGSMPTGPELNLPPYFFAPPIGWAHGWAGWSQLDALAAHRLEAVAPSGYIMVDPASGVVDLSAGCLRRGTFVVARKSTLKVIKFKDMNENGVMDTGEAGMPGVTIIVDGGAQSGPTGGDGSITFTVTSGDHTVSVDESTAPGYYPTGPTTKTVTVPCGGQGVEYFGNAPYGSISGHKWNDTNRNGTHQDGEPPIANVTIKLTGTTNLGEPVNLETKTDTNGYYSFTNLKAGEYTVSEVVPEDMEPTSPESLPVTLEPGENVTDIDFNNASTKAKIQGYKFEDMNENGVMDSGEAGLADVRITLDGDADEARTDSNGYFSFTVDPGSHTLAVDESTAEGYYPTTETSVTEEVTVEEVKTVYFGNAPYGSISGHKYNDKNQNAAYDGDDEPVVGMTVNLTGTTSFDGKTVNLTTTTGEGGSYSFTGLQAGTYVVSEEVPSGMQPVSDESIEVTLEVGEAVADIDFFNTEETEEPQPPSSSPSTSPAEQPQPPASTSPTVAAPQPTTPSTPSGTLPYTGMNKAPLTTAGWLAFSLGSLLMVVGVVRRRRHLDWLTRLAAAVPGRLWK